MFGIKRKLGKIRNFIKERFEKINSRMVYRKQLNFVRSHNTRFQAVGLYPILNEKYMAPHLDRHYFYHPAWAARVLAETKPKKHIDISSTINFMSHISAFIPTEYYEYNVPDIKLDNLKVDHCDLLSLPFADNSVVSLSCMHVVEHIGLGRYGDPFDLDADLKAVKELTRVLAQNGHLLFVVPISSNPRIEFNAHRIYSYDMVMQMFEGLDLAEFCLIPDSCSNMIRYAHKNDCDNQIYACGCFHFTKRN